MTDDEDSHDVKDDPGEVHLPVAAPASAAAVEREPRTESTLAMMR